MYAYNKYNIKKVTQFITFYFITLSNALWIHYNIINHLVKMAECITHHNIILSSVYLRNNVTRFYYWLDI